MRFPRRLRVRQRLPVAKAKRLQKSYNLGNQGKARIQQHRSSREAN
jgi:hypothetical protein